MKKGLKSKTGVLILDFHTGVKHGEGAEGHRAEIRLTGGLISHHIGKIHLKEGALKTTGRKDLYCPSGKIPDLVIISCIDSVLPSNILDHGIVISRFK